MTGTGVSGGYTAFEERKADVGIEAMSGVSNICGTDSAHVPEAVAIQDVRGERITISRM
jgi:hypothetical protein